MVLGYKSGTSDEFPADERGADFAEKLKKGWTFKQAWWYAVDDTWWLDDEAAIVTWGDSFIDSEDRMDEETLFAGDDNEKYCMEGKYGTAVVSVCFDTHVG